MALFFAAMLQRGEAIAGIEKSRFKPPYDESGRTTFGYTRNRPGVYLIKDGGQIVYVGHSKNNLYRTMYRHFQSWTDGQYRATYPKQGLTVRVVITTAAKAPHLEAALIRKYKPVDNPQKLERMEAQQRDTEEWKEYQEAQAQEDYF